MKCANCGHDIVKPYKAYLHREGEKGREAWRIRCFCGCVYPRSPSNIEILTASIPF